MKTKIALSIWLIIWALIFWLGIDLYNGIVEQNVPNYPNSGQYFTCIILPIMLIILNIILFIFAKKLNGLFLFFIFIIEFFALCSFVVRIGFGF